MITTQAVVEAAARAVAPHLVLTDVAEARVKFDAWVKLGLEAHTFLGGLAAAGALHAATAAAGAVADLGRMMGDLTTAVATQAELGTTLLEQATALRGELAELRAEVAELRDHLARRPRPATKQAAAEPNDGRPA